MLGYMYVKRLLLLGDLGPIVFPIGHSRTRTNIHTEQEIIVFGHYLL